MRQEKRFCMECGEPLKGRADKKFCDDACRSNYNNRQNSDSSAILKTINNTLRKNRKILESFAGREGKAFVSKSRLVDAGFHFRYFTHSYLTKKGTTYKIIYNYAYLPFDNDQVVIVKWETENQKHD
ncbi:MAG: DUF2116 family Zn-ribbon domain-containing protein [Bacteroidia bacterium]|nr:DUF2116 family Zn-ribbon domain-containing protein [Bacteroidia bacterium]